MAEKPWCAAVARPISNTAPHTLDTIGAKITGGTQSAHTSIAVLRARLTDQPRPISVDDSQLRITPEEIDTGDTTLSQASRLFLDQRLNLTVPLDTLPFGQQLTNITSDREAIYLQAQSTALILRP